MKKQLIFLLLLILMISSVSATVEIKNVAYSWNKNTFSNGGYSKVTFTITNVGTNVDSGLIALEHRTNAYAIGSQDTCDVRFPNDVNRAYSLSPGETKTVTLEANSFNAGGTFYPYLVHVNKCCTNGVQNFNCQPKTPYGWGLQLNNGDPIKFSWNDPSANDQCDTDYQAQQYLEQAGQYNCKKAYCKNPSSFDSVAVCQEQGCSNGAVQNDVCNDGKTIPVRQCANHEWVETGNKCATGLPPPPGGDNDTPWLLIIGGVIVILGFGVILLKR